MTPAVPRASPATVLAIAGMLAALACLLWMPAFLGARLNLDALAATGVDVQGVVQSHASWTKQGRTAFSATVVYRVGAQQHTVSLRGPGASPARLPVGSPVTVRYRPGLPGAGYAQVPEAGSHLDVPWAAFWWAGSVPVCLLGAAAWASRAQRRARVAGVNPSAPAPGVGQRRG